MQRIIKDLYLSKYRSFIIYEKWTNMFTDCLNLLVLIYYKTNLKIEI